MNPATQEAQEASEHYDVISQLTRNLHPRYKLLSLIGRGPCGRVFKAQNIYSSSIVAVKIVETNDPDWLSREGDAYVNIKQLTQHVNTSDSYGSFGLLEVIDAVPFVDTLWMVSPLYTGGNLKTVMGLRGYLTERYLVSVLRDIARALFWCHSQGITHGNVKAANILMDENGGIVLCDFSTVARGELSQSHSQSAHDGSVHWLAPECLMDRNYFHKGMDIWAFGALTHELATGSPPFSSLKTGTQILTHILSVGPPTLRAASFPDILKDLVTSCCVVDPEQRPPIPLVFSHAYLSSTSTSASVRELVDEYRRWEHHQRVSPNAMFQLATEPRQIIDMPADRVPTGRANDQHRVMEICHPLRYTERASEPDHDEVGTWSLVDDPSRCSSPFDLEDHLVMRSRDFSFEAIDAAGLSSQLGQLEPSKTCNTLKSVPGYGSYGSYSGEAPLTVGLAMTYEITNPVPASFSIGPSPGSSVFDLELDVNFNPDFDIFAASDAETYVAPTSRILSNPPSGPTTPPEEAVPNTTTHAQEWTPPTFGPLPWDSPPASPASSSVASLGPEPIPLLDRDSLIYGNDWTLDDVNYVMNDSSDEDEPHPAAEAQAGPSTPPGQEVAQTTTSECFKPASLDEVIATAMSTPPPLNTPGQLSPTAKGKEPATSPHAWPPFPPSNKSTGNLTSRSFSTSSPKSLKPLPPLPLRKPHPSTLHRPATSGGGGSTTPRSAFHEAVPPVPTLPDALRRPSLDIISAGSRPFDAFGDSFDADGNYIAAPVPPLPPPGSLRDSEVARRLRTFTLPLRPKDRMPASAPRERMIPREAGSCPPPRCKSHPATASGAIKPFASPRVTGPSISHATKASSSSFASSSASDSPRRASKPIPRNASFSVFPHAQPSPAAAAQAAIQARNRMLSRASSNGKRPRNVKNGDPAKFGGAESRCCNGSDLATLPPRRPSAPMLTQKSFFEVDADGDNDSEDYDAARRGSAADLKKGVKRLVNSVSANLGDTIRARKSFKWMKRSAP